MTDDTDGFRLFRETLPYGYYDGAASGVARSYLEELPFVWFAALAVLLWPEVRIYSLAKIDADSFNRFAELLSRGSVSDSDVDFAVSEFAAPTWFCLSKDNLRTVTVLRTLPDDYAAEIDQVLLAHPEQMPFGSATYLKWLSRIVDFPETESG